MNSSPGTYSREEVKSRIAPPNPPPSLRGSNKHKNIWKLQTKGDHACWNLSKYASRPCHDIRSFLAVSLEICEFCCADTCHLAFMIWVRVAFYVVVHLWLWLIARPRRDRRNRFAESPDWQLSLERSLGFLFSLLSRVNVWLHLHDGCVLMANPSCAICYIIGFFTYFCLT